MAKQEGILRIVGTFGDLSFYKSEGQYLVRMKGGPSPGQFKHSPAFSRSRERSKEFGLVSSAASQARVLIITLTGKRDKKLYHALFKVLRLVLLEDKTNAPGKRNFAAALQTPAGKQLLAAALSSLLGNLSAAALDLLLSHFLKAPETIEKKILKKTAAARRSPVLRNRLLTNSRPKKTRLLAGLLPELSHHLLSGPS